jgi:hypothetical protein
VTAVVCWCPSGVVDHADPSSNHGWPSGIAHDANETNVIVPNGHCAS